MRVLTRYCYLVLSLLLWGTQAHATLNIEIFGGGSKRIPIAIVPFSQEEKASSKYHKCCYGRS